LLTDLTTPFSPAIGLIFKFVSSRFDNIDDISNLITIEKFQFGEKLWIDDTDGKWTVYQKNKNFSASAISAPYYSKVLSSNQQFGHTVSGNSLGTKIITSSPNFIDSNGKVFAYRKNGTGTDSLFLVSTIDPNPSNVLSYYSTATMANFGASLAFDNDNDYIFIGYKIYRKIKDIEETQEVKATVKDAKSMYEKLKKEGKKLSDSNISAYSSLANYIQKQFDGCEAITTEAMVVSSIIKLVKAPIDWYYLVSKFGNKDIEDCGTFGLGKTNYDLPTLLKDQLDTGGLMSINKDGFKRSGVYSNSINLLNEYFKTIGVVI
jgi:hypothetical protein